MTPAAAPLALTAGEPAGIGPDLCLALAATKRDFPLVCLADRALLAERARLLGLAIEFEDYQPRTATQQRTATQPGTAAPSGAASTRAAGRLSVLHVPLAAPCVAGRLEVRNARQVLQLLDRAADGCRNGEFAAMVTAPVQKSLINEAGIAFTGHTEYLAARLGAPLPVMLLVAGRLRVALATTHLPLRKVSDALSEAGLLAVLRILRQDLSRHFGLASPRIAVLGLNPHAGEGGHLGDEEQRIISPAIAAARAEGIGASGPWPADTLFVPRHLEGHDAVLAMYHDQGLPVLKHAGFGEAVNVTLGLPILRTSVDHGTALDLAGTGRADVGSLRAACRLAAELAA